MTTSIDIEVRNHNQKDIICYIPKINGIPVMDTGFIIKESSNSDGVIHDNIEYANFILSNKVEEIKRFLKTNKEFLVEKTAAPKISKMRELELRLESENPQFNRVWVQYCTHRHLRIVLTLFSQGTYRMVFGEPTDLSYESINAILQKDLAVSN